MILAAMLAAAVQISMAMPNHTTAQAKDGKQQTTQADGKSREQRMKELQQAKMNILRHELSLNDAQFAEFEPIYNEYRKALRQGQPAAAKGQRFDIQTASDEQVLEHLNNNLDRSIHIATLRKEYIPKFGKVLNPRQIAKLYKVDDSLARKAQEALHKKHGKPQGNPHGQCDSAQHHHGAPHHGNAPKGHGPKK